MTSLLMVKKLLIFSALLWTGQIGKTQDDSCNYVLPANRGRSRMSDLNLNRSYSLRAETSMAPKAMPVVFRKSVGGIPPAKIHTKSLGSS